MLFNSPIFIVFFVVVFGLYRLIPGNEPRKWLLLVASYAFYSNWDWRFTPLLFATTVVDYLVGLRIEDASTPARRKHWLIASLALNLGVLGIFKYGNFFLEQFDVLFVASGVERPTLPTSIPVGISFYTFQSMSYTIDVFRGRTAACRSLRDFALFVSFFPQLVAGPIVRSVEYLPQVGDHMPTAPWSEVWLGAQRFIVGLFKKVVIADNVGLFVDSVFAAPAGHSSWTLIGAMYGFALQIYCDFSAYTDMALGIGRAFGIKFPENFEAPYLSRSITEFWRRWHLSLSRWLRDYLYIPLGGSQTGAGRTYINLMLTMLLGGLWHGASWAFVLWGGYMGLLLALERIFDFGREERELAVSRPAEWIRAIVTFHLVCFGWVLFRGVDLSRIRDYFASMGSNWAVHDGLERTALTWTAVLIGLCVIQYAVRSLRAKERTWEPLPAALQGLALAVLLVIVAIFHVDAMAFIYFQF